MSTALLIVIMYLGAAAQPMVHITQEADMNTCHDSRQEQVQRMETYNLSHAEAPLNHWLVLCLDISVLVQPRFKI